MPQLNVHLTPRFERALRRLMKSRGIATKSEAVRLAVEEAAERATRSSRGGHFADLRGIGLRAPLSPEPLFSTEDELWEPARRHGR